MVADGQREGEQKACHTKACCFLFPWLECCICWSKVHSAIWMHTWGSKVKWRWWNVTWYNLEWRHRGPPHPVVPNQAAQQNHQELCPVRAAQWRSTYHVPSPTCPSHSCSSPGKEEFIVAPFRWHGNWNAERWSAQGHPDGRRWKSFGSQIICLPKLWTSSLHCFQNTTPHGAFGPLAPKHPCHSEHWSLTSPACFTDRNLSAQKELLPEGSGASLRSPKLTQQQMATLYVAPALSSMQLPPSANFKLHSGKQWLGERFALWTSLKFIFPSPAVLIGKAGPPLLLYHLAGLSGTLIGCRRRKWLTQRWARLVGTPAREVNNRCPLITYIH